MDNTIKNEYNYITVVNSVTKCSKHFENTPHGIIKTANASIFDAQATTVRVDTREELAAILKDIGGNPNAALILGFIPGTTTYRMLTRKGMNKIRRVDESEPGTGPEILGDVTCYARLKENFTQSSWFIFDYDQPDGMPLHLKYSGFEQWVGVMGGLLPGFSDAGKVLLPSSSSRLLIEGKPKGSAGLHCLMQAENAEDVERFGKMLFLSSLQAGFGFTTITKGGAHRRATVFDPTTFSCERLLFEGSPTTEGEGLSIAPVDVQIVDGGALDTSLVEDTWEKVDGMQVERTSSGGYCTVDHENLTRDIEVTVKDVRGVAVMTVGEYEKSELKHVRCQTPFRNSDSWAGYLNRHTDGRVFLYDVGSHTKYPLHDTPAELFKDVPAPPAPRPPMPRPPSPPVPPGPKPNDAIVGNLALVAGTDVDDKETEAQERESRFSSLVDRIANSEGPIQMSLVVAACDVISTLGIVDRATDIRWTKDVKVASKLTKKEVEALVKDARQRRQAGAESKITDPGRLMAQITINTSFANGAHIKGSRNEDVWGYKGTHWEVLNKGYINNKINAVIKAGAEVEVSHAALIRNASDILRAEVGTDKPFKDITKRPKSIVNCQNFEVWINDDGSHVAKPHSPASLLTSVLNIKYDPTAKAPEFLKLLNELFCEAVAGDTDDIIRHVIELMGYMMQPEKDIASFWLFLGGGGNGKSVLLKVLRAVMGEGYLSTTTKMLKMADKDAYEHAVNALVDKQAVVIEEVTHKTVLDDAGVKMLSEETVMRTNPKGSEGADFLYTGCLILSANGYPVVVALDRGMRRRAHVIPFDRNFSTEKSEIDSGASLAMRDRSKAITDSPEELSGVLNLLLEGLARLKARGGFDDPESCRLKKDEWWANANPFAGFIAEVIEKTGSAKDLVGTCLELYGMYDAWCSYNDIEPKYRKKKREVYASFEALGFLKKKGTGNQLCIYGGRLKSDQPENA